jgi:2-keto-4-pentenoate hydratase/2-oxohepta-3-ene-1,7-dioic acid hydratase in catechol pathway
MRFIRYRMGQSEPRFGWVYEDRVGGIEGTPFGEFRRLEADLPLESVRLLAPLQPGKIICVGRNYVEHAKELDNPVPDIPLLFLKPPSAVIAHGDKIVLPPQSRQVDHEGELTVVIGKRGRWIPPERALDFVFGYTIANDVTARDLQRRDVQFTRGKGFDTFCPLGPWIETEFDLTDALVTTRVNDEMRQMGSTREMVFSVAQLIAFVSSVMTLEVGDILLTGTPAGVGPLAAGDVVEVNIEGIGTLSNPVVMEDTEHRVG